MVDSKKNTKIEAAENSLIREYLKAAHKAVAEMNALGRPIISDAEYELFKNKLRSGSSSTNIFEFIDSRNLLLD
ncbi:MAG: hypothetical protein DWQ02_08090 [Bacteroidetes bacterium]|nr:MAG: hypothetical protein DWQ02_08090 [Bacteroidota bacterium]